MDALCLNRVLNRESQEQHIKQILSEFDTQRENLLFKKGIYVYGGPGTGKTVFVERILKDLNYDIVKYDAGDVRNTSVIDVMTKHNMSDRNIMSVFRKQVKKIAIVMDEMDGMNSGDKGGINALVKLIRPKKTKKQKLESVTILPIICIGSYRVDKKIKELMNVCNTIELQTPTPAQMASIIQQIFPTVSPDLQTRLVSYVQGDLKKLRNMWTLHQQNPDVFTIQTLDDVLQIKSYNDDTKAITHRLMDHCYPIDQHQILMNETDRTSVGLLWHENIIDTLDHLDKRESIPIYLAQLDNICFADYIDRITFQKQIWQFHEMCSLMKTFHNHRLFHESQVVKRRPSEIRFTKVLTKYSTEFNNTVFIQMLCHAFGMDKKDLFGYFHELGGQRETNPTVISDLITLVVNCVYGGGGVSLKDASTTTTKRKKKQPVATATPTTPAKREKEIYNKAKGGVERLFRYIEKYTKENAVGTLDDKEIDEEDSNDFESLDDDDSSIS